MSGNSNVNHSNSLIQSLRGRLDNFTHATPDYSTLQHLLRSAADHLHGNQTASNLLDVAVDMYLREAVTANTVSHSFDIL